MKRVVIIASLGLIFNMGCSNNSSPGPNGSADSTSSNTISAGPYLAFSDNESVVGHLVGTITDYDDSGRVTSVDQIDENDQDIIGPLENHNGLVGRALYFFPHGQKTAFAYIGYNSDTSEVFGFRYSTPLPIIPKTVKVGQEWSPAPYPISCQVIFKDHLSQFTAKNGKTYSDVIKLDINYLDSTGSDYLSNVYKGTGTLFLSRNIGLVEADVSNYEHYEMYHDFSNQFLIYFNRKTGSGYATRN